MVELWVSHSVDGRVMLLVEIVVGWMAYLPMAVLSACSKAGRSDV